MKDTHVVSEGKAGQLWQKGEWRMAGGAELTVDRMHE